MYTLDGPQKKALHAALRHAFPRRSALEQLVERHLGEQLAAIAGQGALDQVIVELITWAEAHGRLDALVNGARIEVPGNPQLVSFERLIVETRDTRPDDAALRQFAERVRLAPAVPDEPDLEKRVFRAGFSDIAQWRARLSQAELAVCRIEAPAWRALGTGFLIGPDLVMTNRHVIESLATQASPPILVRFDFKLSPAGSKLREGQVYEIAGDWLVASSPVALLDFAVLRLARPAGWMPAGGTASAPSRGWITPRWRELEPDETIFVIQHPQGETLKLASGRYDSREPSRLRYRVDTEPGSSGSPCFTAQMELVALHRGSAEGLANQGVPFDAIGDALPSGFFPPARPEISTSDSRGTVEAIVARVDGSARPAVETAAAGRRRWSPALVAAGASIAVAVGAVPLWWPLLDSPAARPPSAAARTSPAPTNPSAGPKPFEVSVDYAIARLDRPGQCRSDATHRRALFRLESRGAWPGSPRSREVQLVALGEVEIEYASFAMRDGVEAFAVSQPKRDIVRRGWFAERVVPPVVIIACVHATAPGIPQPEFRISTWKEAGS